MSLIKRPHELDVQTRIKAMFYGQSGMGKSTLALSAPKPLLLDFDGGVHRVNYGHQSPTVQIRNWQEANQAISEDLSEFETIVVDTIGKMMDYIIDYVTNGGIPQIRDWNRINAEFSGFCRKVSDLNKNVIFVAHRDTRKEGDDTVFVPALREKSYTAIVSELDLLGYLEAKGTERILTFNPTSRNDGKNTCNLPGIIKLPIVVDQKTGAALTNTFLQTNVITPYVNNLKKRMDDIRAYESVMSEIKENIELIHDADSANDFISRIDFFSHIGNSKPIAGKLLAAKARELGLVLNKEKQYEKAA